MSNEERPVLVYDRIARNRLMTWLLLAGFLLALLPIGRGIVLGLAREVNRAFWSYAGPQPSKYFLIIGGLLIGPGAWGPGADAHYWTYLRTIVAILGAPILVCVMYLVYRGAGAAMVLRVARARRVQPGEERRLVRTVENLCIGAGLPRPRLYVSETTAANAFATGWDPSHASIVVTRGLLARLERRELEAVLAHELSHIGNYDTRLATLTAILSWGLRLPLALFVEPVRLLCRLHPVAGIVGAIALLPGFSAFDLIDLPMGRGTIVLLSRLEVLLVGAVGLATSGLSVLLVSFAAGLLLQRAISRQREYLADAEAFLLTRAPGPLARALAKLAASGGLPMRVSGAFSHLYVTDPFVGGAPWWDRIFSTHPPVGARLARLAEMGGTPGRSPMPGPESNQGEVPEDPFDRVAPWRLHSADVPDGPDRMLIGLTVAGAIGAAALLAVTPSADPVDKLLAQLFSAFLQFVVFTTALYVAHMHRIPPWTLEEWLPGGGDGRLNRLGVAILAAVAIGFHPFVDFSYGTSTISPGLALFPAGMLALSLMWPAEVWGRDSDVPGGEDEALGVAVRESGAPLYNRPDPAARQLAWLKPGAMLVVVAEAEAGFLSVVAPDGTRGYVPTAGTMLEAPVERPLRQGPPAIGPLTAASADPAETRVRPAQPATLFAGPSAGGPPSGSGSQSAPSGAPAQMRLRSAQPATPYPGPTRQEPPPASDPSAASTDAAETRFRLTQPATLYSGPNAGSPPLAQLPIGAMVLVQGGESTFLRLVGPDGLVGYVSRWTAMMRVDTDLPRRK